jgi:co-chaperonin GroES (HSP10)|tara:strand:- start:2093 stop:2596 length:504 start_codon:yes stop_codon:yes gene_type:complete
MTEKELPKRVFALEEKDLSVEADENNKVAEEKENKFLKKIQQEATKDIEHLPDEKIIERLPDPTGWRLLVLPYKGQGKTKGGVILADQTMEERSYTTVTGLVLKIGPDCYKDETRYPNGPWCKKGDWIIFGRYAGSRFGIEGGEVRILNEDEIIAVVKDPEDILQYK